MLVASPSRGPARPPGGRTRLRRTAADASFPAPGGLILGRPQSTQAASPPASTTSSIGARKLAHFLTTCPPLLLYGLSLRASRLLVMTPSPGGANANNVWDGRGPTANSYGGRVQHAPIAHVKTVTPADLLVDVNVRADLRLTKEFVASIKDHDVLAPSSRSAPARDCVRQGHRSSDLVPDGRSRIRARRHHSQRGRGRSRRDRTTPHPARREPPPRPGSRPLRRPRWAQQLTRLGLSSTQVTRRTHTKREADRAARCLVIDNKSWKAAREVRREGSRRT